MPISKKITFDSKGRELRATLYTPANGLSVVDLPTVLIAGAWPTTNNDALFTYATQLCRNGYATFIFDTDNAADDISTGTTVSAESAGGTTDLQDPNLESDDIVAAVTHLKTLRELDPEKIGALGIELGAQPILDAHDKAAFNVCCLLAQCHDGLIEYDVIADQGRLESQVALITLTGDQSTVTPIENISADGLKNDSESIKTVVATVAESMSE